MFQRIRRYFAPILTTVVGIGLFGILAACTPADSTGALSVYSKYTPGAPITACGGTVFPAPTEFQPAASVGCLPTRTPVAGTGPTIVPNSRQVALDILNTLPKQIQNFTLNTDPGKTYVGTDTRSGNVIGAVGVYDLNGDNTTELYVAIWVTPTENDAEDRFLLQYHKMNDIYGFPTTKGELGDESFIAPEVKPQKQDTGFINAPTWASLRFRNVEIDLYPTKNLTDKLPNFSAADATNIQTAIFNALPK